MEQNKSIYFYVTYHRKQKEVISDIDFIFPENKELHPICIFCEEIPKNQIYIYNKIYKVSKSAGKGNKGNNFNFEFEINDEKYIIWFDSKGNNFIYEVNLDVGKKIIDIRRKVIQGKDYYKTMEYFIKALEKDSKELIDKFYKETIKLYANKKGFILLIELFIRIYMKKDLCSELLGIFKTNVSNPKDNSKIMDRPKILEDYSSKFKQLISEANTIIENNGYDFIEFYGLLLCYLNNYDFKTFCSTINELNIKKPKELYDILLIYKEQFINQFNQDYEFYNNFISYTILNKDFLVFEKGLNYIRDIETFLSIIDDNKEKIVEKYNSKIIKLDDLKLKKDRNKNNSGNEDTKSICSFISEKEEKKEKNNINITKKKHKYIFDIIDNIKSIINFCDTKNTFIIYLTSNFWQYILNYFNDPKIDYIYICFQLRDIYTKYYNLVSKIFNKKDEKFTIKRDAKIYFLRDEFTIILDQIIRKYNNNPENQMTNIDKLAFITKYNPYYIEPKYSNKVDSNIFDSFDLNIVNESEFNDFKGMNFEIIFKDNISDYIKKFMEKIKSIKDFDVVMKLINIDNIKDKNLYLKPLKLKYDNLISNEIGLLTDDKLKEAVYVVAKIAILNYVYENESKRISFINERVKKLDKKIISAIYIEIIKISFNKEKGEKKDDGDNINIDTNEIQEKEDYYEKNGIDFNGIKTFIFDEFSNKLENEDDIDSIINLIDCLEEIDKKNKKEENSLLTEFLKKLFSKKSFNKEEFFSEEKNLKILLLIKLSKKPLIQKVIKDYYEYLLDNIEKDIGGNIKKSKLEEFLKNDESLVKKRLELIKLIIPGFNPDEKYNDLKTTNDKINKEINELKNIKNSIKIYHQDFYQDIIQKISDVTKTSQNKKIGEYKQGGKVGDLIKKTENEGLKELVYKIDRVKDFLLFNVIYDMNPKKDENEKFESSYDILENIIKELNDEKKTENVIITELNSKYKEYFKKIKEKLCNDNQEAENFIEKLKTDYKVTNSKLRKELNILFKSKKYELDINSIIFFFNYKFEKDNIEWNKMMLPNSFAKNWEESFQNIKEDLKQLKENKIYDYENIGKYNNLFTCLYNKKEAIDFLFSKENDEILKLKDKIQPMDRTIGIKNILEANECIFHIIGMKDLKNNFKILEYIQKLDEKIIDKFENYSKIYQSIIELDTDDDYSDNIYNRVIKIIKGAKFNILQDTENFYYLNENKNELEKITMKELIHIKNQIHIKNEREKDIDETIKSKCKILLFFKDTISKLEIINAYMDALRKKGNSLPIKIIVTITIKDNEPKIDYYLDKYKKEFEEIRGFLFDANNAYISQLDSKYKENQNLRFLYGKQFRSIMKHIEENYRIDSFLRYILNNSDNNVSINEGEKSIKRNVRNFIDNKQYIIYSRNSLDGISSYITTLFENNNQTLENHYEKMAIKSSEGLKGIYLYGCENNSMEEYIINLFLDKLKILPIAQNVLITNKETSSEEIQAFFHRAILCNYNTLFVVEINDSFSDYQQSIMNTYIDNLLTYKNNEYNKETNEKVDKNSAEKYISSCIVFIYDIKNKNIISFIKEIEKFTNKNDEKAKKKNYSKKIYNINYLNNIFVITSDICGLGKSKEIKRLMKEKNEKYFHFPLGGILTKNIIYDKLDKLLNKINEEINNKQLKYENIGIHLDLTESKETSILNEFFFSFLITRFYTNNENIIYIPKDVQIYIEIPVCFEDYLSKFNILNIFTPKNISLEQLPSFDYSENIIQHFENLLDFKNNNKNSEIQKFVYKYITDEESTSKYSYHQINIFVKLFISQYSLVNKTKKKIKFIENKKDVTEDCIKKFAKCTQYFTNGGFAQLLTKFDKNAKVNVIKILSEVYKNDLIKMKFENPLIFVYKNKDDYFYRQLFLPEKDSNKYNNSKEYLLKIKEILNLPYKIEDLLAIIEEKNNNYVITNDNFRKMMLLIYRIMANVPVIIMGDTGCGKTSLIIKLNQIINGGYIAYQRKDEKEKMKEIKTLKILNIHPGITDEKLCEEMEEANKDAEELKKYNKDLWLFFDEMNTCLSLSLLTEIFINRKFDGKEIKDNIKLIGACNPYRKRKENKEKCGLSLSEDNDEELVYLVNPFPQSLLYYVFSFGSIDDIDEKKYINSILEKTFNDKNEEFLLEKTTDAISQCHIYLREKFDPSVVSLREIGRFAKCIEFFKKYFKIKNNYINRKNNEKNNKIRSIICSIYLCYYIRLTNQEIRFNFEQRLRPILLKLVNQKDMEEKGGSLMEQIINKDLLLEMNDIKYPTETVKDFSDFLKIEQDFLIEQIDLDKGIGKNTLLKENLFLLFLSVVTNIPLIIIGKPGTGKSLSAQLIYKSMRGKYSNNKFFQEFPKIIQIYFQGSESTQPEDLIKLFRKAESKSESFIKKYEENNNKDDNNNNLPIIMILFDELGLAERSDSNPLKVLHEKLEYTGQKRGVSFVGISNYSLDAAKINRALVLSVPDLDERLDDLNDTAKNIVGSISEKIKDDKIFKIISRTYFEYKNIIKIIKELVVYKQYLFEKEKDKKYQGKSNHSQISDDNESMDADSKANSLNPEEKIPKDRERRQFDFIRREKEFKDLYKKEKKIRKDFHGNRDFYNIIRGIATDLKSLDITDKEKVEIIIKYIERNFGGIDYEIDIDFKSALEDTKTFIEKIQNILSDYNKFDENNDKNATKLSSVFLFKKLYNIECEIEDPNSNLKIDKLKINDYNLNKCINDNIKDNSRYLLLEIKSSLTPLICRNIKLQNPNKTSIELYDGSPFIDDNNKEYRFKVINKIQEDASEDKLIIIENLNQIHPFLFDLYNMNYIIKNNKKLVRICLENFNEQLTEVNEKFRIIILVDKNFVNKCNLAFLNRLEKMNVSFDKLLDNKLKLISSNLLEEIKLKTAIHKYKNINYSLKDLLINCGDEEIQGLIYYFSKESQKNENEDNEEDKEDKIDIKSLEDKIIKKIYKILPQDIICILNDSNIIKQYYKKKTTNIIYNYKDYINEEQNYLYKISIIYTYTGIANNVTGLNKKMSFMASQIRSEDGLKRTIDELKSKNDKNKIEKEYNICIDFEQSNSKKIKFVSNFILSNFLTDKYHYIFIVHINRNFIENNELDNQNSSTISNEKKKKKKTDKIYSLPDINPYINQIFIDNLNGNNIIQLKDLLGVDITKLLEEKKDQLKLNEEFNKVLVNTLNKELNKKDGMLKDIIVKYIKDLQNFMNQENEIRDKIIGIAYTLIENNKNNDANFKEVIDKLYRSNFINKYTIDISSCLIEYIKENIFNAYIKKILLKLEDNNILTTLIELQKNNFEEIDKDLVKEIVMKYLDGIVNEKSEIKPESKFLFNYFVPGFYNFFKDISSYINKNITFNYYNNEKKIREAMKADKIIEQFHNLEDTLLNQVNKYATNNEFVSDILKKVSLDLIFSDYITFYLQKNINNKNIYIKDDEYHKFIELLLQIRFKNNKINNINDLLRNITWIESNVNYILNIITLFEIATKIYNDKTKLYNKMEELIFKNNKKIKYITNKDRNPEHTKEVNECYYIVLASICYCITSEEIEISYFNDSKNGKIEVFRYHFNLTEAIKILQNLDNDLYIFLNEMYIIDELIKIIELFNKKNNINLNKINEIKNMLRENALIIQEYSGDTIKLSDELINNFEEIYNAIIQDEIIDKNDKDYYDKLRYILYREIRKISDNDYRFEILKKLLESNEMIKKSKDIFQILLKNYVKKDYKDNRNNILNGNENIIKLLEKKINKNFVLEETLLYFFEKNAFNYLESIINSKKEITNKNNNNKKETIIIKLEDDPLLIFKEAYEFLNVYINEPQKFDNKLPEMCKLFCLGYIKSYIHTFIKTFEDEEGKRKFNDYKKILDYINKKDSIFKMIRIYIYKILYNNFGVDVFINPKMIKKYKLNDYNDFNQFIQIKELNNIYKIKYKIRTVKEECFNEANFVIEKYLKDEFKNKISKNEFDLDEFGIDNFYNISYNLILSNLLMENPDLNININFYNNICEPLFKDNQLLLKAIKLFYNPEIYKKIKESFKFNSNNIKAILFGYRYCLNELSSRKTKGIYYPLYGENYLNYLNEQFYPGNDTKPNEVYSGIINHFSNKPYEGCYVCLCKDGFYHSIKSGFPGDKELDKVCPKCQKNIGTVKKHWYNSELKIVKRDDYYRIFKSKQEIEKLKKTEVFYNKLKEINFMTIDEYKEKYIINNRDILNQKGVYINRDQNYFKNVKKAIRNLSQISFRILNYILFSHLFFARLVTNMREFDNYLPKGMSWAQTLYECWIILKKELSKVKIYSIEKFLSYIFSDIFPILNKHKKIDDFESLIEFENTLESNIQQMIKKYRDYDKESLNQVNKNNEDKNSFISLLKETYTNIEYSKKDYPFYEYFYFTDYIDDKYVKYKLSFMDESRYPVLKKYIESKGDKTNNSTYSLENLNLFNKVLNLFYENYNNKIPREYAQKTKLINEKIYKDNNKVLIDKFINFINNLKEDNEQKLSIDNCLSDFLLDSDNKFGSIYIHIYHKFIEEQNKKLENLLDNKIDNGIFDMNCKNRINIQQIDEKEIFTLSFPKGESFRDILFNSSYRKIVDNDFRSIDSYKEYEIDYDLIEEHMTEVLLRNKKLLNNNITEIIYNDEVFTNEISDLITMFKKRYGHQNINIYDKVAIYDFYKDNQKNSYICAIIINDFITLLKYKEEKIEIANENEEKSNITINEETKIYEIVNKLKDNFSNIFIKLFENNESLTFNKTCEIFFYYLKLIFQLVEEELNNYKNELGEESKEALNNYFNNKHLINKKDFSRAIRLFTTLVLFLEENKEKKIKNNRNNIVNYLRANDLWESDIYNNEDFNKNLNELKLFNIQINQIISLFKILGTDIEENLYEDIKKEKEKEKPKVNEIEKVDNNFNNIENDNYNDDDPFAANNESDNDERGDRY